MSILIAQLIRLIHHYRLRASLGWLAVRIMVSINTSTCFGWFPCSTTSTSTIVVGFFLDHPEMDLHFAVELNQFLRQAHQFPLIGFKLAFNIQKNSRVCISFVFKLSMTSYIQYYFKNEPFKIIPTFKIIELVRGRVGQKVSPSLQVHGFIFCICHLSCFVSQCVRDILKTSIKQIKIIICFLGFSFGIFRSLCKDNVMSSRKISYNEHRVYYE